MSRPQSHILSARTDRGAVRPRNEDAVLADVLALGREFVILLAVADGVGGHGQGDWASRRSLELLREHVAAALGAGADPRSALTVAFQRANEALYQEGAQRQVDSHPATTLAAALVLGESLWWANVGDSRVYLVGQQEAQQLSLDHSLVADEVRAGTLRAEDAAEAPFANVITRSIGYQPTVEVDSGGPIALAPGDVVLLCSDGLYRVVFEHEIASLATMYVADSATRELITLACERGAPDNVSVVIYRVPNALESQHDTRRSALDQEAALARQKRRRPRFLVAGVTLAVLAAVGLALVAVALGWVSVGPFTFGK